MTVSGPATTLVGCAIALFVLGGCATDGRQHDATAAKSAQPQRCGSAETFSCVERMGEAVRCFCADKDTLRELFDLAKIH